MKKRIVVVEPDRDIREIVSHILADRGFEVIPYDDDEGMFDEILKTLPDVVLLDIFSITEKGTALCRKIKNHPQTRDIPLIVLSTHMQAAAVKEICAEDVIPKPFDIDHLIMVVEEHVCL